MQVRVDALARLAAEGRNRPHEFRVTIRPGVDSNDVHEALRAVGTAIGAHWLVYVIEPSEQEGNPNTHAHVVAALDGGTRSNPAPDEATDLGALQATIASVWTLGPEVGPTPPESVHVGTLPGAEYGSQTRRTATGYFLTYMLKRWFAHETHQDHGRLLGGQDRPFRLIGISQTRVDVEAGLTLPPVTSTAPVRDGLQERKPYPSNRKGSTPRPFGYQRVQARTETRRRPGQRRASAAEQTAEEQRLRRPYGEHDS